jgi:hypothetical protein
VIERRRGRSLADAEAEARKIGLSSPAMTSAFHRVADAALPATGAMAEDSAHRAQGKPLP